MYRASCAQKGCKWCDTEGICQKKDTSERDEMSNNVDKSGSRCPNCFEEY